MARRIKTATAEPKLPSRDEVVAFLKSTKGKVGKREIARAFGIEGADKTWLKGILKELEADGVVERRGRKLHQAGRLPPVVLADIVGRDPDGELIAEPADWISEDGAKAPRILIVAGRRARPGAPVAGVGDRALVRVEPADDGGPAYAGRVMKIIAKKAAQILGVFRAMPEGGGRLIPVEKRSHGREIVIAPGDEGGAQEGDLVAVTTVQPGRLGLTYAKVRERLGSLASEKAVSMVAIHVHNIPHVFSAAALKEAESAKPASPEGREDWRDLPLITIDPADAKDHDDAVHAAPDTDPGNPGGFVVTVAIADVSAYVRPGSAMDREALERGNSVYFPDRVVPMLPERISNDLCSLRPHEDRPALAVRMIVGADGRKRHHAFHRVLMRSHAKVAYAQAQAAIDGRPDEVTAPILDGILRPLWAAYACVRKARDAREPLDLDLPERKILLKPDGTVDRVVVPERLDAHRLIEEFMILANVAAAEALETAKTPLIYRTHDEPSLEKMRSLGEVMASIGQKAPQTGALRPGIFNGILRSIAGSEHETFVNEVVLRTQAQAEYTAENYGHFGLNLRRYAHFTSPIRRYADLVVHRALVRAFRFGEGALPADVTTEQLAEIAAGISAAERRAMAAERETVDRLIAQYLADQVGAIFEGRISGVTKGGLFVKLFETGADGFVPAATIGDDYYRYDEAHHALTGDRTGESYRLGDPVSVKLVEAAPVAGALRFEILSEGRKGKPSGARRPGRPFSGPKPGRGNKAPFAPRRDVKVRIKGRKEGT
ncbi:ribonuclease R [Salinarimonas soli]|uniref:Ribonuclease R n=1 Tax=Salinarimonas soli TaxID=1638099 RepID=A0A5B2VZT4_9HYPH|nr:ribonuclease R [Salinarimonas soli]KAA2243960.1 ribonuclease R [Salinarimonas soli]